MASIPEGCIVIGQFRLNSSLTVNLLACLRSSLPWGFNSRARTHARIKHQTVTPSGHTISVLGCVVTGITDQTARFICFVSSPCDFSLGFRFRRYGASSQSVMHADNFLACARRRPVVWRLLHMHATCWELSVAKLSARNGKELVRVVNASSTCQSHLYSTS